MSDKAKSYSIGLTGGIASGKSAVSRFFEAYNCTVIDADIIAREVVEPNSVGLNQLVDAFGTHILNSDKHLDRAQLRKIVFNNKDQLLKINSILHPLIQSTIQARVKSAKGDYCVVVIPLLCESNDYKWLDRVLVVDVSPETQLERLLKRDSIDNTLAQKMMGSQCSRKQRLAIADDVINNEQSLAELKNGVKILNRLYKSL